MKKEVMVEKTFCDVCGKEASGYQKCMSCGKDLCYDCYKTSAVGYTHGVHFGGSGDGIYCLECDEKLLKSGDKLHAAYRVIKSLRNEVSGFYADFEKRAKEAEERLGGLRDSGGGIT